MQSIRFHHHHWPGHGARRDYISQDAPEQAIYHCFNGRGGAEVIIVCELILGSTALMSQTIHLQKLHLQEMEISLP